MLPPRGLACVPWVAQPNPFCEGVQGAGAIFGAGPNCNPQDLVRALAAGLAFEVRRVFDQVMRNRLVESVVLSGGAANGFYFRNMLASLAHPLPVYWQRDGDLAGARGALTAFSDKAACGKLERIASRQSGTAEIMTAYDDYTQVFRRVYGHLPSASPFNLKRRHHATNR
jgi:sugar (pentulose or hexulose) kinase